MHAPGPAEAPSAPSEATTWIRLELMAIPRPLRVIAILALTFGVLVIRRPDQFTHPALWAESGRIALEDYASAGWSSLFWPVAGYTSVTFRAVNYLAFAIDIDHAPWVAVALACAVIAAVVVAVAECPTELKWRWACGAGCVLVPLGAEPYATSLMSFWWFGLLLLLALLWSGKTGGLRTSFIWIGGLSTPIIVVLAPLFIARAALIRSRGEFFAASQAAIVAAVQAANAIGGGRTVRSYETPHVSQVIGKFVGFFFSPGTSFSPNNLVPAMDVGTVAFAAFIACAVWQRTRVGPGFWLLLAAIVGIVAMTLARLPLQVAFPFLTTPRYFFYPFIIEFWLLIWLGRSGGWSTGVPAVACLAFAVGQGTPHWRVRHTQIDWPAQLRSCAAATGPILVHTSGMPAHIWRIALTAAKCQKLMDRSIIPPRRTATESQ